MKMSIQWWSHSVITVCVCVK